MAHTQFGMIPEMAKPHVGHDFHIYDVAQPLGALGPAVVVGGRAYDGQWQDRFWCCIYLISYLSWIWSGLKFWSSQVVCILLCQKIIWAQLGFLDSWESEFSPCSLITNRRAANLEQPLGLWWLTLLASVRSNTSFFKFRTTKLWWNYGGCSLVAGFEYALFFIPEMCGLIWSSTCPKLHPGSSVIWSYPSGARRRVFCWGDLLGCYRWLSIWNGQRPQRWLRECLEFSDRLDMSWFEINNWIDGWYIEMVIRRVGWCSNDIFHHQGGPLVDPLQSAGKQLQSPWNW